MSEQTYTVSFGMSIPDKVLSEYNNNLDLIRASLRELLEEDAKRFSQCGRHISWVIEGDNGPEVAIYVFGLLPEEASRAKRDADSTFSGIPGYWSNVSTDDK